MRKHLHIFRKIITFLLLMSAAVLMSGCFADENLADLQLKNELDVNTGETFQDYLWYENPVVLLLHIALMLAGAIGVVALLPAPYEEETIE